jgi:hypothetical protein
MGTAIVAFIFAILGAGGAVFAILKGVDIATKKYPKKTTLPAGKYTMRKVAGTEDVYDLELLEEEVKK